MRRISADLSISIEKSILAIDSTPVSPHAPNSTPGNSSLEGLVDRCPSTRLLLLTDPAIPIGL